LKLLIGLTLPVVLIIVAILALQIYCRGFERGLRCEQEVGFWGKLRCGISETYEDNAPYFRRLPTDEEMIEHFQKHRADFERLVRIYREDPKLPTRPGFNYDEGTPEAKEIMERINIGGMRGDWQAWVPPDPYSVEAKRQVATLKLIPEVQDCTPTGRKYSGVLLDGAHRPVIRLNADLTPVFKGYYYTPLVPKIENGLLKKADGGARVFATLNRYPSWLICGNCVYRQFEPQWFIRLCQACK